MCYYALEHHKATSTRPAHQTPAVSSRLVCRYFTTVNVVEAPVQYKNLGSSEQPGPLWLGTRYAALEVTELQYHVISS